MADFKDRLASYVEVKDRLAVLFELYGQARVVTSYELTREPDQKPKVIVRAIIYRTPDDPVPATGTSWMYLPGATTYTRGSELENAETSAVGRAIGLMGILIDRSIATSNEIDAKKNEAEPAHTTPPPSQDAPKLIDAMYSETGRLVVGKKATNDGLLRSDPDGSFLMVGFEGPQFTLQVLVRGQLAVDLYDAAGDSMNGRACTVEGALFDIPFSKDGKQMRPYKRLILERILTGGWTLPGDAPPTVPLFDEGELDKLVDALP